MDFFRGVHAWRKLENLIHRLPATSQYREAVTQDDELAEAWLLTHQGDAAAPGRAAVPLTELSVEVQLLMQAVRQLERLGNLVLSIGGGKPSGVTDIPVAETALGRARARITWIRHAALVDEVAEAQARWTQLNEGVGT